MQRCEHCKERVDKDGWIRGCFKRKTWVYHVRCFAAMMKRAA